MGVAGPYASRYRARLIGQVIRPAGWGKLAFGLPMVRDYLRQAAG